MEKKMVKNFGDYKIAGVTHGVKMDMYIYFKLSNIFFSLE